MDHKEKGFESHAATFTFDFTTIFTTLGFRKKIIFNFLHRSLRHVLAGKKTNFISPLCSRGDDHEKDFFPYYIIITLFTFRFIKNTTIAATSTTPWSWKKMYIISFQHYYIHHNLTMKKLYLFPVLNCYHVHYAVIMIKKIPIATTFSTPLSWQKYIFSFQHYVYYALVKKEDILVSFQYYIHYALITTFIFITALPTPHDKISVSIRFVHATAISPSGISWQSYMLFFSSGSLAFL